ncbi:MAG TPA: hypothetical protein VFA07_14330 [Chthonomonadaceae bacterium]|nr:hypothetical protein [Chthonomonadaceae bacterium]
MISRSLAIGGLVAVLGAGLTLSAQAQKAGNLGRQWHRNAGAHANQHRWVPARQRNNGTAQANAANRTINGTTPANTAARTATSAVVTVPGTETTVERPGKGAGIRPEKLWKLEGALKQLQRAREELATAANPEASSASAGIAADNSRALALIDQAISEVTATISADGGIPVEHPVTERRVVTNPAPTTVTGTPGTTTAHATGNPAMNPSTPVSQTGQKVAPHPQRRWPNRNRLKP